MAISRDTFLVDATFLLEASHEAFLGAPLLVVDGKDHTFLFGVIRDLLRLRSLLGIERGAVLIGQDGYSVTEKTNVERTVSFLRDFGIPVVHEPQQRIIDISAGLAAATNHLITRNRSLLLFAEDHRCVVVPKTRTEVDVFTSATVSSRLGIPPRLVPAFLALTEGPKTTVLTKRQAVALLERHGDLASIIKDTSGISSRQIKSKLTRNASVLLERLRKCSPNESYVHPTGTPRDIDIDNQQCAQMLEQHHFFSLVRLLPSQATMRIVPTEERQRKQRYQAVLTPQDLEQLVTKISNAKCCAVDTEASDKDPHTAELFGVSFSVKKDEAFYVPTVEHDLQGLERDTVISTLKELLQGSVKVVGHNLKYDYVLLRNNGVKIANVHFDTMLAAYECFSDWDFLNLPFVAKKLLGKKIKSYREIVGERQTLLDVPFKDVVTHACEDADATLQLYRVLQKELRSRGITKQYRDETLALAVRLGDWEYDGIPIKVSNLTRARTTLQGEVAVLRTKILSEADVAFNVDSEKELGAVLARTRGVAELLGNRKPTLRILEELAVSQTMARLVVQYRRLQRKLRNVEEVMKAAQNGKLHPIFSQTKSGYGRVSSVKPRLFEDWVHPMVHSSIEHAVSDYFRSPGRSLDIIQTAAKDEVLLSGRVAAEESPQWINGTVLPDGIDSEALLVRLLIGASTERICREFLINQSTLASVRHDLETRLCCSFEYLADYRRSVAEKGLAVAGRRKRWFNGVRSSNLGKRDKALRSAVRWLLEY